MADERVTLCIQSAEIAIEEISFRLQLVPTRFARIGEHASLDPSSAIRKANFWSYQPDVNHEALEAKGVITQLQRMKAALSAQGSDWLRAKQKSQELSAYISVYLGIDGVNNVDINLDSAAINWLASLGLPFELAIYTYAASEDA